MACLPLHELALSVVEFVEHGTRVVVDVEVGDLHVVVESDDRAAVQLDAFVGGRVAVELPLVVGPVAPRERHRRRTYGGHGV